ncbi:Secretory lipase family protein [Tolypocladium paradoxum]|uniref:Secretory lipase family protein n=1 Tax=Tolypocladium paradoxum TaxID=94208 RepID=A0A2S4L326_9HYPO|nr:Secretory lipase family protein [Tolypocladium paradoxum]
MARFALLWAALGLWAAALTGSFGSGLQSRSGSGPPSKDPFYDVPSGIDKLKPGSILKHRKPPSPLAAFGEKIDNLVKESHQILYRTTDTLGNATATVLTLLVPPNADYGKILSFQAAEDAASIDCAPSFGYQLESTKYPLLNSATMQLQLLLAEAALDKGWVVISADSEGPKGAYPADKLAAYATLDGIRAAVNSAPFTGIKKNPRLSLWGYSGGGSVTLLATELQPAYAPELKIAGAALGGVAAGMSNLSDTIYQTNKGPVAGFIPITLLGLAAQYPELGNLIDKHLKPQYRDTFYKPLIQCLEANKATFMFGDIAGMFDDPDFIYTNPTLAKIANDMGQSNGVPKVPLFWYHYVQDQLIPIKNADTTVEKYCAEGVTIEYQRETARNLTHATYGLVGAPDALRWLQGVMNGQEPKPGCSNGTVATPEIDPTFLKILPKKMADLIITYLAERPL